VRSLLVCLTWTLVAISTGATPAFAQRAATEPVIDNDRVTVWDISREEGATRARRIESHDSLEIALSPAPGAVVFRRRNAEPNVAIAPVAGRTVVIELKGHPVPPLKNTSRYPSAFPRPRVKKVIENERLIVWDYSWTLGEPTPMLFHDKDVVVVYLADGALLSTTPQGERVVNEYSTGSIRFNTRDRIHSEELTTGTQRAIIVELK
jgi:hypothetical protein